jgi:site-specific recombinase XerC
MVGADEEEAFSRNRAGLAARSGRKGESLNSDYAALRAFTDFLHRRDFLSPKHDPSGHLKSVTQGKFRPHHIDEMVLPTEMFRPLLDAAGKRHPRDRMIIALGLFAGFRDSEMRALLVSGVNFEKKLVSVFRQKSQKWHTVPMVKALERELRMWFEWLERHNGPLQKSWHVIGARLKGNVGTRLVQESQIDPTRPPCRCRDAVQQALRDVGATDLYRPGSHTLRRMAGNAIMDYTDGNVRAAKGLFGHQNESITENYLQRSRELSRLQSTIGDFDPLASEPVASNVVDLDSRRHVA